MGEKIRNLYLVTLKGMTYSVTCAPVHGVAYVVASDPTTAVFILQDELKRKDLGVPGDQALDTVKLLAENVEYPDCKYRLYIEE